MGVRPWAKPIPVDRSRFRTQRKCLLAVTLAGVSINFLLAAASAAGLLAIGAALRLAHPEATSTGFSFVFSDAALAGLPGIGAWELAILDMKQGLLVNTVLFALNVLPIPPLDGFGVLESVLPTSFAAVVEKLRPLGMVLLLLLVVFGVTSFLLLPAMVFAAILNLAVATMTGWS